MFLSMAFFNRDDVCILAKNSSLLKSFAKKSQGLASIPLARSSSSRFPNDAHLHRRYPDVSALSKLVAAVVIF